MSQDAPRNDVYRDDRLLDFGTEVPDSPLDEKGPDLALNRNEPDAAIDDGRDPAVTFDIALSRQEPVVRSDTRKAEIHPDAPMLPLHASSDQQFVWSASDPVHSNAWRNIGIALLMLAGIGALAWSGRSLMGMRRDAGTSGAQIQDASQPTSTAPLDAPTNDLPPTPDPQVPATDLSVEAPTPSEPAIAPPSEPPAANAPAPRAERPPAPHEPQPTVNADPNAASGLFAITRPVGAQVFVDNKLIGTTPLFMSQLSPGSHEVRLELSGFKTYSSSIQVEPNMRFRLAVQLDATP
jgi:hypothetical protein